MGLFDVKSEKVPGKLGRVGLTIKFRDKIKAGGNSRLHSPQIIGKFLTPSLLTFCDPRDLCWASFIPLSSLLIIVTE